MAQRQRLGAHCGILVGFLRRDEEGLQPIQSGVKPDGTVVHRASSTTSRACTGIGGRCWRIRNHEDLQGTICKSASNPTLVVSFATFRIKSDLNVFAPFKVLCKL